MPRMLQDADFKTLADLTGAGATAADLLNDTKMYVSGLSEQHSAAITNGDIVSKVLLATKGNIPVGNGTGVTALGVGTNNQVLIADSTQASGVKWGTNTPSGIANMSIASKTANYTATSTDDAILCDATSASFTITLPAASSNAGKIFRITKTDSSVNTVTIARAGSDLIIGETSQVLYTQYTTLTLFSDGSANWYLD